MKKLLLTIAMLISVMVLFFAFGTTASAETYGNLTYYVTNKQVEITGCTSTTVTSLTIPEKINNYPVTKISSRAFDYNKNLKTITLPSSLTSIGDYAFDSCTSLTKITFGNNLTSIGERAFQSCTALTQVTFGNSSLTIGSHAFVGCTSLKRVDVPSLEVWYKIKFTDVASNPMVNGLSSDSDNITDIYVNNAKPTSVRIEQGIKEISDYCFMGWRNLTRLSAPYESLQTIGEYAFYGCTALDEVFLENGLKTIGSGAFLECTDLTGLWIPDTVTSIGGAAFADCTSLRSITFPAGVTIIDNMMFSRCASLQTATFKGAVTEIAFYAFSGCTSLTSFTIPDTVAEIESKTFQGCTALKSVTIPDGVTSIGTSAFADCVKLESINIPESVIKIQEKAFENCQKLKKVYATDTATWMAIEFHESYANPLIYADELYFNNELVKELTIPDGTTAVTDFYFPGCACIEKVNLPASVVSIEPGAFSGYIGLKEINIPSGVTSIGDSVFSGCASLAQVNIPKGVTTIGDSVFSGCASLAQVTIPKGVTTIGNSAFSGCASLAQVTIPQGVTTIGNSAFSGCKSLADVTLQQGVTTISASAFMDCGALRNIIIPDSVKELGESAFYACKGLESVTLSSGIEYIRNNTFYGCEGLKTVNIPEKISVIYDNAFYGCKSLTDITIPEGVQQIGNSAFSGCTGLTEITLPDSVKELGNYVFNACTGLRYATIGKGIAYLNSSEFDDCNNLIAVFLPDSIKNIYESSFDKCSSIRALIYPGTQEQWEKVSINKSYYSVIFDNVHVYCVADYKLMNDCLYNKTGAMLVACLTDDSIFTVPGNVQSLSDYTFWKHTYVHTVIIPSGVRNIGSNAFNSATNLQRISIPASVTTIAATAFNKTSALKEIYYGGTQEQWKNLTKDFSKDYFSKISVFCNTQLTDKDGNLYTADGETFVYYDNQKKDASFSVADGTKIIKNHAFADCDALRTVSLPVSLNKIGYNAFENCDSLGYITIPENVTVIEGSVFFECKNLTTVGLPEGGLSQVSDSMFAGCDNLAKIYIPANIKSFGSNAFSNCNSLSEIYFGGTEEKWNAISITSSNSALWGANIYFEHNHTVDKWEVLIPVEKYKDGIETGICSVCEYKDYNILPCNHVHKYDYAVTTPATCIAEGLGTYTCECADSYTETIPATGHSFTNKTADKNRLVAAATCCSKAVYYLRCANCDVYSTEETFEHGKFDASNHKGNTEIRDVKTENCGVEGYTGDKYCLGCESVIESGSVITATGNHDYSEYVVTREANCQKKGLKTAQCKICNNVKEDEIEINPSNHSGKIELLNKKDATCTEDGFSGDKYCPDCDKIFENGKHIDAYGHPKETVPAQSATCTETGLTAGEKCSVCGEVFKKQEITPATGHTEKILPEKTPTCTKTGLSEGKKCSVCNEILVAQEELPIRHGYVHNVIKPTCKTEGYTSYTCLYCYDTYTDSYVEKLEHDIENSKCRICDTYVIMKGQSVDIPVIYGVFYDSDVEWYSENDNVIIYDIISGYSFTAEGFGGYSGARIKGESEGTDEIIATDNRGGTVRFSFEIISHEHVESVIPGYAATCNQTGLTDGIECSICSEIIQKQQEIPVTEHTVKVIKAKSATCTESGLTKGKKCSVCNEILTAQEEIAATGHTEEIIAGKSATCTESGLTEGKKCSVCNEILIEQEEIAATGHTEEIIAGKSATCTESGLTDGKKCSVCNEILTVQEKIVATGHDYVSVVINPTCKNGGYSEFTCSYCSDSYMDNLVEKLQHEVYDKQCEICDTYVLAVGDSIVITASTKRTDVVIDWYVQGKNVNIDDISTGWSLTAEGYRAYSEATIKAVTVGTDMVVAYDNFGSELEYDFEVISCAHEEEVISGKSATCTESGNTEGKKCSVCGEILVVSEEIPAKGHTPGEWEVVIAAGVGKEGKEQQKCLDCGDILDERSIAALPEEPTTKPDKPTTKPDEPVTGDPIMPETPDSYPQEIPAFYIHVPEGLIAGDTFSVVVAGANFSDLESADIDFYYDSEMLEFISIKEGTDANYTYFAGDKVKEGQIAWSFLYYDESPETFDIAVITFRALKSGSSDFSVIKRSWNSLQKPQDIKNQIVIGENGKLEISDDSVKVDDNTKISTIGEKSTVETVAKSITNTKFLIVDKNGKELDKNTFVGTGAKIQILDSNGKVINEYTVCVPNDIDGNGKTTAADARLALRNSAKLENIDGVYAIAADVTGDKQITAADARKILRVSAGLEKA